MLQTEILRKDFYQQWELRDLGSVIQFDRLPWPIEITYGNPPRIQSALAEIPKSLISGQRPKVGKELPKQLPEHILNNSQSKFAMVVGEQALIDVQHWQGQSHTPSATIGPL